MNKTALISRVLAELPQSCGWKATTVFSPAELDRAAYGDEIEFAASVMAYFPRLPGEWGSFHLS